MSSLLARARVASCRVWAIGSPYGVKDALYARQYRWNDGSFPNSPKSWYRDVPEADAPAQMEWLKENVWCRGEAVRLTARDRHSERAMALP